MSFGNPQIKSSSGSSVAPTPPGPAPAVPVYQGGPLSQRPAAGRFNGDSYLATGVTDNPVLYLWNATASAWEISGALLPQTTATLLNAVGQIGQASLIRDDGGTRHLIVVAGFVNVTAPETGGALQLQYTALGTVQNVALDAGGHGNGTFPLPSQTILADVATNVLINQSSALTAGNATVTYSMALVA